MNDLRLSHQKSLILVADRWLSNVVVLFIVGQCLPGFAGCLKQYLAKHLAIMQMYMITFLENSRCC